MKKVLLATASGADRQIARKCFKERKEVLVEATNGIEAYDKLIDEAHYLVMAIINFELPIRSGKKMVEIMKNSSKYSHIPVLMGIDPNNDEEVKEGEKTWAEDIINRPYDQMILNRKLANYTLDKPLAYLQEDV